MRWFKREKEEQPLESGSEGKQESNLPVAPEDPSKEEQADSDASTGSKDQVALSTAPLLAHDGSKGNKDGEGVSEGGKVAVLNNTLVEVNVCIKRGVDIVALKNKLGPGEWFFVEVPKRTFNITSLDLGLGSKLRLEGRVAHGRTEYKAAASVWTTTAVIAGAVVIGSAAVTGGMALLIASFCTAPAWMTAIATTSVGVSVASKATLAASIGGSVVTRTIGTKSEFGKDGIPVDGCTWLRIIGGPGSAGGPLDLAGKLDPSKVEDFVVEEGEWQVSDEVFAVLRGERPEEREVAKEQLPISYLPPSGTDSPPSSYGSI